MIIIEVHLKIDKYCKNLRQIFSILCVELFQFHSLQGSVLLTKTNTHTKL